MKSIGKIPKYLFITITTIIIVVYSLSLLFRVETIQRHIATQISNELKTKLELPIKIGSIRVRHLNEISIKNTLVHDQTGDTALYIQEATAHISPLYLLKGDIQINTLAFSKPVIKLNRDTKDSPLNIQFIIDKLSKGEDGTKGNISLRINQFLIHDGIFCYDEKDAPVCKSVFNSKHIRIEDLGCNISIKRFHNDTIDVKIRSIYGKEQCGIELNKISANVNATRDNIIINRFKAIFPESELNAEEITFTPNNGSPSFTIKASCKKLTPSDFAALGIPHSSDLPKLTFYLESTGDCSKIVSKLSFATFDNKFSIKTNSHTTNPYNSTRTTHVNILDCHIEKSCTEYIQPFIKDSLQQITQATGDISISGEAVLRKDNFKGSADIMTQNGHITANAIADYNGKYTITLSGKKIDLKEILHNSAFDKCNITTTITGNTRTLFNNIAFSGRITDLNAGGYKYVPIEYAGYYTPNKANANITINDPAIEGKIQISHINNNWQNIDVSVSIDTLIPNKLGLNNRADETLSFRLNGEFRDYRKEGKIINIKFDNFTINDGKSRETIRNFHICDNSTEEQRLIILSSDFINGSIIGEFDYKTIISNIGRVTLKHTPALQETFPGKSDDNNYIFKFDIRNTQFVSKLFNLPITINEPSTISGTCNSGKETFRLDTRLNNVRIGNSDYNTIVFDGKSDNQALTIDFQAKKQLAKKDSGLSSGTGSETTIGLHCTIVNDTIKNHIYWNNNRKRHSMKGNMRMDALLGRNKENLLTMNAHIHSDSIVHNDSVWKISEGAITGDFNRICVNDIKLYNSSQSLAIEGIVGQESNDSLFIALNNLEVSTILDFVNFHALHFAGCATGKAHLTSLLSEPNVSAKVKLDSLKIDGSYMGSSDIEFGWDNNLKSILLDCGIHNPGRESSRVHGFLSQAHDTICLQIDANTLNLGFIEKKIKNFVTDINGTGNGKVKVLGSWRKLDIIGATSLDCSLKVAPTNTTYFFTGDTLRFSPGKIGFNSVAIKDRKGNNGTVSGYVSHQNLAKWRCKLKANAHNLLIYDTHGFEAMPFYGTVFATGTVDLSSDENGTNLKAQLRSEADSRFVYNSSEAGGVRDNSFVTFTDISKKKRNRILDNEQEFESNNFDSKLNLDFLLDMRDAMQLKVYTNLRTDDYIDLYGNGILHAVFDDKEGFTMKGNLDLTRGTYKFTIQDIFPKEFSITKGSTLVFNGNPFEAALNLKTKHLVPSAMLSDLTTETSKRKSVKVNCLMDITGTLNNPTLNFDLELPEGNEEERELLASMTSTTEQKNMQFIYLLGIGKFYTYDNSNAQAGNPQSSTAMESLISNTLSGQLNNMLGQIIDNGNWDFSGNFSTSKRGWNDMEVEGMLEGRLLDNRLLINGNFGYRENPTANKNFIGDFEIQWLLNKTGSISLKAYSKTNDRYFSKTNLTTQGAGIMLRHDFNNWLWWRKKEGNNKKD